MHVLQGHSIVVVVSRLDIDVLSLLLYVLRLLLLVWRLGLLVSRLGLHVLRLGCPVSTLHSLVFRYQDRALLLAVPLPATVEAVIALCARAPAMAVIARKRAAFRKDIWIVTYNIGISICSILRRWNE